MMNTTEVIVRVLAADEKSLTKKGMFVHNIFLRFFNVECRNIFCVVVVSLTLFWMYNI